VSNRYLLRTVHRTSHYIPFHNMRLLNAQTLHLKTFTADIPPYIILSHTWGQSDEEVVFQDIGELDKARAKDGFKKIAGCCSQARQDGFEWAWIDTCCIDKTSSAELSEAINSMFRWYQDSHICYVYLSDVTVSPGQVLAVQTPSRFPNSRWFSRGWTLQELVAPRVVHFFDSNWNILGTKLSLTVTIHGITKIPEDILRNRPRSDYCVADIMSWAAGRETTRLEDTAYSLMGLFNINIHLLYREGGRAFFRLQDEILKTTGDYSLFAWAGTWSASILASSPSSFESNGDQHPYKKDLSVNLASITPHSTWGNILQLDLRLGDQVDNDYYPAYLNCRQQDKLVCLKVWPSTNLDKLLWRRTTGQSRDVYEKAVVFCDPGSLPSFKSRTLSFDIGASETDPRRHPSYMAKFSFERLPPCMQFIRAIHVGSMGHRLIRDIDNDHSYSCHLPTDLNYWVSIYLRHQSRQQPVPHQCVTFMHSMPMTSIHPVNRNHTSWSHMKSATPKSSLEAFPAVPENDEIIQFILSTSSSASRTARCVLQHLFHDPDDDFFPQPTPMSSDCTSLVLKTGCVALMGRRCILKAIVKPVSMMELEFAVTISCSGYSVASEALRLRSRPIDSQCSIE
jgi:hypothetical protein